MDAYFFNFSKRKNSTKWPTLSLGDKRQNIKLKDNCSLHNPVLQIKDPKLKWNYCVLDQSGSNPFIGHYFIDDLVQVSNEVWEVYLSYDLMAQEKTDIGSSKFHVAFSSTYTDPYLVDPRISVSAIKVVSNIVKQTTFDADGCYCMTVMNSSPLAEAFGLGVSYLLDETNMGYVREWLVSGNVLTDVANLLGGTAMGAVYNCIWIPYKLDLLNVPATIGTVGNMMIGNHNSVEYLAHTINAVRLNGFVKVSGSVSIDISSLRSDFRRIEPYTSAEIYLPGIGCTDLNMADWVTSTEIDVDYEMELPTGNVTYILRDANGPIVQSMTTNLSAQCPLGQMTTNTSGVVASLGGVIGGAVAVASGGSAAAVVGAASMIMSGANAVLQANRRAPSISGSIGSRSATTITDIEVTIFEVQTEDPTDANYIAERGRPVAGVKQMSTLSGFVQCEGASISGNLWAEDYDTINNYLNSGFFYE